MFWNKIKDLTAERDYLRAARDEALSRLDAKSRECERLVASTKIAIDASATDRQLAKEWKAKADACQSSLEKYDLQMQSLLDVVHGVRTISANYSPIDVDCKRLKATLSTKLREAQAIIAEIQTQSQPPAFPRNPCRATKN